MKAQRSIAILCTGLLVACSTLGPRAPVYVGDSTGSACAPGHDNNRALLGVDLLTNKGGQTLFLKGVQLDRADNLSLVGARLVEPEKSVGAAPFVDGPVGVEPSRLEPGQRKYLVYALEVDAGVDYGTALGSTSTFQTAPGATSTVHTCFALAVTTYPACNGEGSPEVPDLSGQMDGLCTVSPS